MGTPTCSADAPLRQVRPMHRWAKTNRQLQKQVQGEPCACTHTPGPGLCVCTRARCVAAAHGRVTLAHDACVACMHTHARPRVVCVHTGMVCGSCAWPQGCTCCCRQRTPPPPPATEFTRPRRGRRARRALRMHHGHAGACITAGCRHACVHACTRVRVAARSLRLAHKVAP